MKYTYTKTTHVVRYSTMSVAVQERLTLTIHPFGLHFIPPPTPVLKSHIRRNKTSSYFIAELLQFTR